MTWHDARILLDLALAMLIAWFVLAGVIHWLQPTRTARREPMSGKRYGKPQSTRLDEPYEFEIVATLDDDDEVHGFIAVRQVDRLLGTNFTAFGDEEAHKQVELLIKLISKTLDDKDGTPATWAPIELPVRGEEPARFRGPDGELYEMEHAVKFAAYEAGSSRRRFLALTGDQDRTVQAEDLVRLVRDLMEVSAGRPTDVSAPSSA